MTIRFLRTSQVLHVRALAKSRHYEDVREGRFVTPLKRGSKIALYPEAEVNAIMTAELAGKSDQEIKELVVFLHKSRVHDPVSTYFSDNKNQRELTELISKLSTQLNTLEALEKEGK